MNTLLEIIQERETPGILIFDLAGRLLFSNESALDAEVAHLVPEFGEVVVCDKIQNYLSYLTGTSETRLGLEGGELENLVVESPRGGSYSVRPFLIGDDDRGGLEAHILFLIEKIIKRHEVHLERSRRDYGLTRREAEVAGLVCKGCSNREISKKLFISEFTVKNHMRKIIVKTGANSRNQVLTRLQ
ncbi:LuxR C-terminal-related transcriptional regulator [Geomonas sp. Red276]